jgi:phospho-N-acetylmuramoyl-pentapeptide-transferase
MLYYLFTYLEQSVNVPGAGLFQFISFRAAMAILVSVFIALFFGKRIIRILQRQQIGETVRELGLQGEHSKTGTPTMGGIILLLAIFIPTLLFAKLGNVYILLSLAATVWLGIIGFLDDYIKNFLNNKEGLAGRFKLVGQIGLGLLVALVVYFHSDVVIREHVTQEQYEELVAENGDVQVVSKNPEKAEPYLVQHKSTETTIPFLKNNELDYAELLAFMGDNYKSWSWLIYIPLIIFIVTAVSNGANLTDGLDGLAAGVSAIVLTTLAAFAYVSGNTIFANYLNIMYIPNLGEVVIFAGAMVGACIGFLWFNAYPAQVFMGDTGSLSLGGLIAILAIIVRKELLIPLICGIFLIESLSVILQVAYFKYTKQKYGEGQRILQMSPLHHHYQKVGYPEPKIVTRFWIIGISLALISVLTLKLR